MQDEYIAAHQEALQEFDSQLETLWKQITNPNASLSLVLTIMTAKEFTEWGRLVTAVAEAAYKKGWNMPTLSGIFRPLCRTLEVCEHVRASTPPKLCLHLIVCLDIPRFSHTVLHLVELGLTASNTKLFQQGIRCNLGVCGDKLH